LCCVRNTPVFPKKTEGGGPPPPKKGGEIGWVSEKTLTGVGVSQKNQKFGGAQKNEKLKKDVQRKKKKGWWGGTFWRLRFQTKPQKKARGPPQTNGKTNPKKLEKGRGSKLWVGLVTFFEVGEQGKKTQPGGGAGRVGPKKNPKKKKGPNQKKV